MNRNQNRRFKLYREFILDNGYQKNKPTQRWQNFLYSGDLIKIDGRGDSTVTAIVLDGRFFKDGRDYYLRNGHILCQYISPTKQLTSMFWMERRHVIEKVKNNVQKVSFESNR